MVNMSEISLSKKWRLAVKENLFDGSFKEFASIYNESFAIQDDDSEEHFSDDASKSNSFSKEVSDTTSADLKRFDKASIEELKIMGMPKTTFIIVSCVVTIAVAAGLYLLVNNLKKKEG